MATVIKDPVDSPLTPEEEHALVPVRMAGTSLLDRWLDADPDKAAKRIEAMVRMIAKLREESIRCTYPSDWIIHTSTDQDGVIIRQVGYLQDHGAERAGKLWGVEVTAPAIEEKAYADGSVAFYMLAEAYSKVTGERLEYVEGSRWSGDQFFRRSIGPDEKVDPTDVRKAAYANLHGRAVRALTGLNSVPLDILKAGGVDTGKVVMVSYARGARGGDSTGASVGAGAGVGAAADFVMAWGSAKGQKASELSPKELAYYITAYERDIANPDKANFKRNNERGLAALRAVREARDKAAEQTAGQAAQDQAPGAAPGAEGGAEAPSGRAALIAAWHTRMMAVLENNGRLVPPFMRSVTAATLGAEKSSPSDLTDTELSALSVVTDEQLKAHVPAKK